MLALLLALAFVFPQSPTPSNARVVRENHADGTPHLEYEVVDVKGKEQKHGTFREWHPGGALKAEGKYEKDLSSGPWTFYDTQGAPTESGRFAKGERVGAWTEFWPGGQKRREGKYVKGRRGGKWSSWNSDGSVDAEATGEWRSEATTWPDGSPREEGYTCNGARLGPWTAHAEGGAPLWTGEFSAGRRDGAWSFHRADGTKQSDGEYVDGVAEGDWTSYWDDGKPQVIGHYEAGKRSGEWQLLFPDGRRDERVLTGTYHAGIRTPSTTLAAAAEPDSIDNLAALPAPPLVNDSNPLQATRIREYVKLAMASDSGTYGAGFSWLTHYGRAAMPVVLDELRRVKLDTADGVNIAHHFDVLYFRATWVGESFDLPRGLKPADFQARLRWWRSWYAVWMSARDLSAWWDIDLRAEPRTNERRAELARMLAEPPIFEADRTPSLHERTPIASLALRFGPRDAVLAGAEPGVVEAVKGGLAWLAAHQSVRGWWDSTHFTELCGRIGKSVCTGTVTRSRYVGITSLALLAFLADGNTPEHGPYAANVSRAVSALLDLQNAKTGVFVADWQEKDENGVLQTYQALDFVYEHALATLALAETLAVSEHPALRKRLERGIATSLQVKLPYSGWGYFLPPDGTCDTSVTAWMVVSLDVARQIGIAVPPSVFQDAVAWCDQMTDPEEGRTGYNVRGSYGSRVPGVNDQYPQACETLTGGALMCRWLNGATLESDPLARRGVDLIMKSLPMSDPLGLSSDAYGWYWCTLALRRLDDERYWPMWRNALERTLLETQLKVGDEKGSWDAFGPWAHAFGRIGNTALALLALEAAWQYAPPPRAKPSRGATKR